MKSKINTLLPIALAATLPGLSLFANPELEAIDTFYFLGSWLRISVLLYFLWFLLAQIWKLKPVYRPLAYGLIIGLIELSVLFLFADLIFVERIWFSVFRVILASVLFLAIQFALRAQQNIAQLMLDKEQIQTENYRVQLNALRTQIDPHFLFNSLNTLRSMVRQGHHNSENFVMSLADFYRKTLKHNEHPTLPLAEELLVLESYVFLMKSRNEKAVIVNIAIDEQMKSRHLPALALQIVVENCFKHNSMTSKNPLNIHIETTEEAYITVSNTIQPKIGEAESTGYGLDLVQKRYDLLKVSQGLSIRKSSTEFRVKLKLL